MMNEFYLEKRAQSARILLDDGAAIAASVFLTLQVETLPKGSSVAELVEDSSPALPCLGPDGQFWLVGTDAISAVALPLEDTGDDGFYELRAARVKLRGGHELEGFIRQDAGIGRRLSDAFHGVDKWIQLETDNELICFRVSQLTYVVEVVEDEAPAETLG